MINVKDLCVKISNKPFLGPINFCGEPGELIIIAGPNGAGKTTLLSAISGEKNYTGSIYCDKEMKSLSGREHAHIIGVLSQFHSSTFDYTVSDIVKLGLYSRRKHMLSFSDDDNDKVEEAMEAADIYHLQNRRLSQLSGGEIQRVYLAQLIAQDPKIMLLDEPINHLDINQQEKVMGLIQKLSKQGHIIISVMHDLSSAKVYADKVLLLSNGKQISFDAPGIALSPENLKEVYGFDAANYIKNMLSVW